MYPDVWVDKRAEDDLRLRSLGAGHWMKGEGVLCGLSAAVLHGAKWIDEDSPAEIMTRRRWHGHPGLTIRRQIPLPHEITERAGFSVTTPARTAYDLARRLDFDDAVIDVDDLAHAVRILGTDDILRVLDDHPNHNNRAAVRAVAHAIDAGAESPQETLTRLRIVEYGLPRPQTQIVIRDVYGTFIGRVDLGYREWRVIIEYEGGDHGEDDKVQYDVERYYALEQLGWRVVRVTKRMVREPWELADRVEKALRARGWSPQ